MEWYEELDFDEDPFSVDPRENHEHLVAMEEVLDEVFYRIQAGSMLVVEGPEGSGKTSVLMAAAKKYGGKKNVVYVDCEKLDKDLNITHVLQDKYGLMGRLFNKKPKDMTVLLDNVHKLSNKNTERIKFYFDQNYIRSIIFTTTDYKKAKFSDSLKDRIGLRVMKTPELSEYDAVEIIRNRIGDIELFNEPLIKKMFEMSNGSPNKLLLIARNAAIEATKKSRTRAQMSDLKIVQEVKNE